MKKSKKNTILVAVPLIGAGLILSFGAILAMGFDFTGMNTRDYVTRTYTVEDGFANISIEGAECDIRLLPSEDASCKVVCSESKRISHSVTVKENTLTIERKDTRRWYEHIGIYWGAMEIAIYLPQAEYESLYALSLSGTIEIPEEFSFGEAEIHNTSGDVCFQAAVKENLRIKTVSGDLYVSGTSPKSLTVQSTSGDIEAASVRLESDLQADTVSGDMEFTGVTCQNFTAGSTSGEITLKNVIALGRLRMESTSGDMELESCDGDSLYLKTVSGAVSGTLLTEKTFATETTSGDISLPKTNSGGKCTIKTTSGDITFTIE